MNLSENKSPKERLLEEQHRGREADTAVAEAIEARRREADQAVANERASAERLRAESDRQWIAKLQAIFLQANAQLATGPGNEIRQCEMLRQFGVTIEKKETPPHRRKRRQSLSSPIHCIRPQP